MAPLLIYATSADDHPSENSLSLTIASTYSRIPLSTSTPETLPVIWVLRTLCKDSLLIHKPQLLRESF
ncbi:MAG: hypothetical protein J7L55_05340 [Desulfurococcales archaeon]|nr:hypothetical protein [Desulfurococcales archaeon]